MTIKSKIAAGALAAGSMLAVAPAMAAVDVTGTNGTTGANSNNENNVHVNNHWSWTVNNQSHLNNDVDLDANTGHNNANENTVGGSINTGDVNATVDINNVANAGLGDLVFPTDNGDVTVDFGNDHTGFRSNNENNATVDNRLSVVFRNNSRINNDIDLSANTGHNNANRNTEGGNGITTGDANFTVNVTNAANGSTPSFSGLGGGSTTITGGNNITGANSNNENNVHVNNNTSVRVTNDSNIVNNINAYTNTGHNNSNENTVGGSVDTGSSTLNVTLDNSAN
jgi:hypothetical protein